MTGFSIRILREDFMGLFGSSFEKLEAKGDRLLTGEDFTGAAQAYRSAFRKAEKKDPEAARRLRVKVDQVDERVLQEFSRLVREHLEDGEPDVAREHLEIARNFAREHPGKYDEQIRELEAAIRARVKSDVAESQEQYEKQMQEDLREEEITPEIIEFEQALNTLGPEDAEEARSYGPHFQKGFMTLIDGDFATAADELQLATHERPESALIYEQLGKALEMGGRSAEARGAYRKALQRDPRRLDARLSMATILDSIENNHREALEVLAEGIEEVPAGEYALRMSIAGIHLHRKRPADTLSELENLLEVTPDGTPDLLHMYGTAHETLGNIDDAGKAFQAAYASDSRNPARRVTFVEFCLRHNRDLDSAESALHSICQSCGFPGDPGTLATFSYYLSLITSARGQPEEALSQVARALSQGIPPQFEEKFAELKKHLENAADRQSE